jgi:hypothetical protein
MFQFKAASVGIEPGRFFHLGMICVGSRVNSPIAVASCLYEKSQMKSELCAEENISPPGMEVYVLGRNGKGKVVKKRPLGHRYGVNIPYVFIRLQEIVYRRVLLVG